MFNPAKESSESSGVSSSIVSLSLGVLCADQRAKLVHSILANPETAALAKLGLRVSGPAHQTASAMVHVAGARSKGFWNVRNVVTGACASLALVAVFSFSNVKVPFNAPALVAMNQEQSSDHFGTAGSFEGIASSNRVESMDRFGSGGFEAK